MWPRDTDFTQLASAVMSTVDHPLGSPPSRVLRSTYTKSFLWHAEWSGDGQKPYKEDDPAGWVVNGMLSGAVMGRNRIKKMTRPDGWSMACLVER
jgi:hypothetical protein